MKEKILELVERYCMAVSTQRAEDFIPLWNEAADCMLISPGGVYSGISDIYEKFLIGRIYNCYSRIELVAEDIDVRITGDCAIVVFRYSTDCDLRGTGEKFGIAGLETQVYNMVNGQWKLTHIHYSKA